MRQVHHYFVALTIISISQTMSTLLPNQNTKIVRGTLAQQDYTKHQVSIREKELDQIIFGLGHKCGGTLISQKLVLTAAHCLYKKIDERTSVPMKISEISIVLGTLNIGMITKNTVIRNVSNMTHHKDYNPITLENDIAILQMDKTVSSSRSIAPIELTNQPTQVGMKCQITGWGSYISGGTGSLDLRTANVVVINLTLCNASLSYNGQILPGMFCAGDFNEGGVDSCQGDSGGPIVCSNKLYGVISWGYKCGLKYKPGVYADVHYYLDWIKKNSTNKSVLSLFVIGVCLLTAILL